MHQRLELSWLSCGEARSRNQTTSAGRVGEARLTAFWFSWYYQGTFICKVAGKTYKGDCDHVQLFQPGHIVKSQTDPLEPTGSYHFGFQIEKFNSDWPSREKWPINRRLPRNDIVRPIFEYIMSVGPADTGTAGVPLGMVAAVEMMLTEFILGPAQRNVSFPYTYPQPLQRVLEWVFEFTNSRITEKVSLDELAQVSGVCSSRLCRLCKQHLGFGPVELVYVYRVTKSLYGLSVGQKIESMANDLGFSSAAHFTRRFERMFGKSPRQMRTAMAKGYKPKLPDLPYMK